MDYAENDVTLQYSFRDYDLTEEQHRYSSMGQTMQRQSSHHLA